VARDGKVIEVIGTYNPLKEPTAVSVLEDKAKSWIAKGALPSKTVTRLLVNAGVISAVVKKAKAVSSPTKKAEASAGG
ncbi:MAG: 30S ribosomal protein S16, partial [Candidatus Margulisiibacteriota bacterium]